MCLRFSESATTPTSQSLNVQQRQPQGEEPSLSRIYNRDIPPIKDEGTSYSASKNPILHISRTYEEQPPSSKGNEDIPSRNESNLDKDGSHSRRKSPIVQSINRRRNDSDATSEEQPLLVVIIETFHPQLPAK